MSQDQSDKSRQSFAGMGGLTIATFSINRMVLERIRELSKELRCSPSLVIAAAVDALDDSLHGSEQPK